METEFWQIVLQFIKDWYWVPVSLGYIFVLTTILIENRNPTKTIAWLMIIVFIPLVGIIFYFFFGQKFKKIKSFTETQQNERKILTDLWNKNNYKIKEEINTLRNEVGGLADIFQFLNNQYISPLTTHNEITLLTNGEEKFKYLLQDLKQAKHHIHLEYYIFKDDIIGNEIINILIDKRKQGVLVRVILDDFGSSTRKFKKIFEQNNIEFHEFLPVKIDSLANSNYRTHRKIVIIDGIISYVGGINVADKYINQTKNKQYWRDTAVKIKGSATGVLQLYFWNNWNFEDTKNNYLDLQYFPKELDFNRSINFSNSEVAFTFSNPGYETPYAMDTILLAIYKAEKSIKICTPYFIPTEQLITALQTAAMRGVQVEIILPSKSDSKIVHLASISFTKSILKNGVKIYFYKKGFMHAKTILIDKKISFIGTINLDTRSFYLNFELTTVIYDLKLAEKMNNQFNIDRANSELLTIEKYLSKGIFYRGLTSICRLLSPIL